jgi:hypothetical protein
MKPAASAALSIRRTEARVTAVAATRGRALQDRERTAGLRRQIGRFAHRFAHTMSAKMSAIWFRGSPICNAKSARTQEENLGGGDRSRTGDGGFADLSRGDGWCSAVLNCAAQGHYPTTPSCSSVLSRVTSWCRVLSVGIASAMPNPSRTSRQLWWALTDTFRPSRAAAATLRLAHSVQALSCSPCRTILGRSRPTGQPGGPSSGVSRRADSRHAAQLEAPA